MLLDSIRHIVQIRRCEAENEAIGVRENMWVFQIPEEPGIVITSGLKSISVFLMMYQIVPGTP